VTNTHTHVWTQRHTNHATSVAKDQPHLAVLGAARRQCDMMYPRHEQIVTVPWSGAISVCNKQQVHIDFADTPAREN